VTAPDTTSSVLPPDDARHEPEGSATFPRPDDTGRASARASGTTSQRSLALLVLEGMRPRHWSKNLFVFAGIVFGNELFTPAAELKVWAVFVAFCLVSGAAYLLNDSVDVEVDRANPRTATRPIARGDLSQDAARKAAAAAAILA
jgi:4-hydroxybenzoate polyprenyltransferase